MKSLYKFLIAILFSTGLQGCYTMLWSPDMEFPNSGNSYQTINNYYYGDYFFYYNSPWWYNITPEMTYDKAGERTDDAGAIRNSDGGRGSSNRTGILNPGTPGRNSGRESTVIPPKSNETQETKRSGSNENSGSDIRNNDSGRNTDKGKR